MKINKESLKYLKQFIKSLNFNQQKWLNISEIRIAEALQTIIENINYKNKSYMEIMKEIYEEENKKC